MTRAEPLVQPPSSKEPAKADGAAPTAHGLAMSELDHGRGELRPAAATRPAPVSAVGDLRSPLRNLKARLTVCVGSAEVTVGDLLDAREDQVLRLDRTVEQPVDLLLEGHVVARGTLVAVDDHFAVRITELPTGLDLSLSATRKG